MFWLSPSITIHFVQHSPAVTSSICCHFVPGLISGTDWRGCWTKWRWKKKENSKRIQTDSTFVWIHSFAWKQWPTFSYINLTVGHHCFQSSSSSTSSQWLLGVVLSFHQMVHRSFHSRLVEGEPLMINRRLKARRHPGIHPSNVSSSTPIFDWKRR